MQLRAEQLHGHLAKSLAPVYAVHGDEPLLALEAADAVRAAARRQGFSERVVLEPGRSFDWSEFTHAAASLSLFAEKKLVELRDRKSTRLNSSHLVISYAVFCLKKKKKQ